ncbi:MAG TPA: MBL fold metallo-hydrolase [Luteibaculaceae bacterium]|nr:MBL fold metallo-hydrolase [Luteibaculaceae bacterium]
MKIVFTGTGTSQGVPVIACNCEVCISADSRDKRLRSSILVEGNAARVVVDTGPDFRQQMLSARVSDLDAVFFTHEHKDHVAGLDDVRAFNFKHKRAMPLYCSVQVEKALRQEFSYAFSEDPYPGAPQLIFKPLQNHQAIAMGDLSITPFEVMHGKLPVFGFSFGRAVYITDANAIPEESWPYLQKPDVLIVNALRRTPHHSHFSLDQAIDLALTSGAKRTYLTHISHLLGTHSEVERELPQGVHLAFDGLEINV